MGKYIKYFENELDLAAFINFDDHSAPNGIGPETWVAHMRFEDTPRYSTGDNNDYIINAQFSTAAYNAEYAELYVFPSVFNAKVYDMDGNLIGNADAYNTTQMFYYIGVNDGPFQKTFSATVKYFDWYGGLVNESVISGTQTANPNVEPISAIARLTITSDGVNPSRIGAWELANAATGFTYQYNGSEVDMSNDVYQDGRSMMYQFPSAGTYEVDIKYGLDPNGKLAFVPNLSNTDANKVYFYTNYPQYAEQVDFSIGGYLADSSAVTEVVLGEGVQKFTGMPWMNLTNLEVLRFLDTNKLPEFQDWQMSWGVPTGVTANADENADGYDAWTAATANYNWTWINPLAVPLTFEITSPGNIVWNDNNGLTIMYSKNGGDWLSTSGVTNIPVVEGDVVQFKGDNASYGVQSYDGVTTACTTFSGTTCGFDLKGNIYSLSDSDDFNKVSSYQYVSSYAYKGMFCDCVGLESAANLSLPSLFLADGCYELMFYGCTNMTEAPYLPSTNLADHCYDQMFSYCQSLERAPELPADTLVDYCYYGMFHSCSSLNYIKCLAIDISAFNCTSGWVEYVPSSGGSGSGSSSSGSSSGSEPFAGGTFVKDVGMTDWQFGDSGIPNGWTVVDA